MKTYVFLRILLLAGCGVTQAAAQAVFTNPITDSNPSASNPFTAGQTVDLHLTVTGIGRGTGLTASSAMDRYNASSWNTPDIDAAGGYFTWTLSPASGYSLSLTSLIYSGQASGSGPTSFALRSSVDSFSSDIGSPTASGTTITLSTPEFQNLTGSVEFRLYGWGASASGGTFSVNDFTFNGSVSAIPEPSTYAAICGGVALAGAMWHRRRRAKASTTDDVVGNAETAKC